MTLRSVAAFCKKLPDMLLGMRKLRLLRGREIDMDYAFYARAPDNAGDAHHEVIDAIFSLQQCADGEDSFFVDRDGVDDTADRRGDSMIGVALLHENFDSGAMDFVLDFIFVD